ncbi:MAG: iron ABC transporter permease [Thermotaleaceae bacterium]
MNGKQPILKKTPVYIIVCIALLAMLILTVLAAVAIGSANIKMMDVYKVIGYKIFNIKEFAEFKSGSIHDVIWLIRLPRIVLAIAVGMGLAVCGVIMQAIVKNPLADPYIIGISSGASLGATLAILLGIGSIFGSNFIGVMAFLGALAASIGVMILANVRGHANSVKLLLAGMAISSLCSAFSSFIVYIDKDKSGIQTITYWLMGSLAGAKWSTIAVVMPVVIVGTLFFMTQFRILNMMLLGDEVSITLGKDLHKYRHVYLVVTTIIIGFVVYSSGMIGFVGLIIPHMIRMISGTDHRRLLPLSALVGSIFLIWCDVLCRIIIPNTELPIGILTSIIGAPFFVYLMVRKTYGFGGAK